MTLDNKVGRDYFYSVLKMKIVFNKLIDNSFGREPDPGIRNVPLQIQVNSQGRGLVNLDD